MTIRRGIFSSWSLILIVTAALSPPAHAADYTAWAVPEQVERVKDGILVKGLFGDAQGCGMLDRVYYPSTHADYELVASMALTALVASREMRFYVNECIVIGFHWSTPVNQARNGGSIYIR